MHNIQRSTIYRAILWFIWIMFTAFYVYPKHLRDVLYTTTKSILELLSRHHETLILIFWAIFTLILIISALVKVTKDEDAKRGIDHLAYMRAKSEALYGEERRAKERDRIKYTQIGLEEEYLNKQ